MSKSFQIICAGCIIGLIVFGIVTTFTNDLKIGLIGFMIGYSITIPFSIKAKHNELKESSKND